MLTSLWTYVLGSCCLGLANVSCRRKCSRICICRSMCRSVCSRGVYVMWQLLASLLSHTATLSIYLSMYLLQLLHPLSANSQPGPPNHPSTQHQRLLLTSLFSEHLVQFYYALHCILLTVLSTSVENWLNINICTVPIHPPIPLHAPPPSSPPVHFPFGFVSFVAMCAGIFITTATTRSHRILFINANINRCKMHRFHLPKSAMISEGLWARG